MASRLNEFTRFMNDFGPRAFDQLAVGRLGASIAAAAEGIPADVTPLDGLAAHWSTLSADEKTRFFRRLAAGAPATGRRRPKKSARGRAARAAGDAAAVEPKRARAKDEPKKKDRKAEKKAKKEAKAKAKEAKKLRKKEAKAKEKAEKKAKKMAKAAEKKATAAQPAQ